MLEALFWCLEVMEVWMENNRVQLNITKVSGLSFRPPWFWGFSISCSRWGCTRPYKIGGNLGVLLDSHFLLEEQMEAVAMWAFAKLCVVKQLHQFLDQETLLIVTLVIESFVDWGYIL